MKHWTGWITSVFLSVSVLFSLSALAEAKTLTSIIITPSNILVDISEMIQLSATAYYSDGTTADITNSATWSSDSSSYVSVSSTGLIEGAAKGTTTIRVDSAGIEGTAVISVTQRLNPTNYNVIRNSHFGASSVSPGAKIGLEVWSDFADLGVHYMRMPVDIINGAHIDAGLLNAYDQNVKSGQSYGLIMYGIANPRPQNGQYDTADDFASALQSFVQRYDGEGSSGMPGLLYPIKNWEVCNEIRYDSGCSTNCYWNGFSKTDYLSFMNRSGTVLKAYCPDCSLLNGALMGPPSLMITSTGDSPLVDLVQDAGTSIINAISYHDYGNTLDADAAVTDFAAYGLQSKPVWATETDMRNKYADDNSLTQDDNARLAVTSFSYALYKGFSRLIATWMRSPLSDTASAQWASLIDPSTGEKRKWYYSYKKLIEKLDYLSGSLSASVTGSSVNAYKFTVRGYPVYVLWASSNQTVQLNLSSAGIAGVKITSSVPSDSSGAFLTQYEPASGGVANINIASTAVYVEELKSYPFGDAASGYWAYNYINAIYNAGITTGEGQSIYGPLDYVTRGQMAAFLIRALYGENFTYTQTPYFSDVPSSNIFFKYVQRLKDDGITTVTGTYNVNDYVSRAQMAKFLITSLYGSDTANFTYNQTPYFTDEPSSDTTYFPYIQKLKDVGITTGCGPDSAGGTDYCPSSYVTRDQMAAFLSRTFLGMQ